MFADLRVEVWMKKPLVPRPDVRVADFSSALQGKSEFCALQRQLGQSLRDLPLDGLSWQRLQRVARPFIAREERKLMASYLWLLKRRYFKQKAYRRALQAIVPFLRRAVLKRRRASLAYTTAMQQLRAAKRMKGELAAAQQQLARVLNGASKTLIALKIEPIAEDAQGEQSEAERETVGLGAPSPVSLRSPSIKENLALIKQKLRTGGDARAMPPAPPPRRSAAERKRPSSRRDWSAVPGRVSCWLKPTDGPSKPSVPRCRPQSMQLDGRPAPLTSSKLTVPDGITTHEICAAFRNSLLPKLNEVQSHPPLSVRPGLAIFDSRLLRLNEQLLFGGGLQESAEYDRLQEVLDDAYTRILQE